MAVRADESRSQSSGLDTRHRSGRQSVRRFYIYIVAAITLLIAAVALTNLAEVGLDKILNAIRGTPWLRRSPDWARDRLSFTIPLLVIAAPLWYAHWRMAQRSIHGEYAEEERRSQVRSVYFAAVFLITSWVGYTGLVEAIQLAVRALLGERLYPVERETLLNVLAISLMVIAVWVFHIAAYLQDTREETAETSTALAPQAAFYFLALVGAVGLLVGGWKSLNLGIAAILQEDRVPGWWHRAFSEWIAMVLAGGLLWAVYWFFTERLLARSTWWGKSKRGSDLRHAYLIAILAAAAVLSIYTFGEGIGGALSWLTDSETRSSRIALSDFLGSLLAIIPLLGFWELHRRRLLRETTGIGYPIAEENLRRLLSYTMAFVGLVLMGYGAMVLVSQIIGWLAGDADWRTVDADLPAGVFLGGAFLWAWYWRETRARLAADPSAEQDSPLRRAYLFAVLGVGLVVMAIGVATVAYRILQVALGTSESADLASEIALPVGTAVVAIAAVVPHGMILRREMALSALAERDERTEAPSTRVTLVLTGPDGGDLDDVLDTLRRQLPEGYHLTR